MPLELTVPSVGESVSEVEIGEWLKQPGEPVARDEPVVVIETDKATMEIFAPEAGTLTEIRKPRGERVQVGDVVGILEPGEVSGPSKPGARTAKSGEAKSKATPSATAPASPPEAVAARSDAPRVMPAAARLMAEEGVATESVQPTGPGGRILKEDVQRTVTQRAASPTEGAPPPGSAPVGDREEEVVKMSLIRRKIAERLVQAQQNMALLTTFNEVDMSAVIALRRQHQERFQERHGIKLGFMSFFVKAVIEGLKDAPGLNAEIRGTDVVYRNYYDIGVAIGGGRGLVVPVLRNADRLGFARIEQAIAGFARQVKENKIKPDDLAGGTFTLTNGGIYGSMLSTPLINAPQSGVLGMHAIQDRAVVIDGQVVVRPMMYLALTYDHRIVDGREAVTFLRQVKDLIEQPARILLEV
ncbi:MAG: 2-oxoglutarate dehydrogenase complex dihydrolipoyllysine-residue succinyltransferase [Verrucomicrobiales bacterium]|nr:2-oxoglutarate dehydrogenase complex dihydrolipoyllysine-residue succinyltransferase [Verrucomicrobiales bacterium]MCP5527792.1 2-oxoglutarate dehydrogenase complex dihydrolipoyllysine-residue succinyltransferase [Verrucomicrobiales bacterium]